MTQITHQGLIQALQTTQKYLVAGAPLFPFISPVRHSRLVISFEPSLHFTMSGNGLAFGLNLSSKPKKPTAPPKPKKPVFGFAPDDDADDGEEDEQEEEGSVFGKAKGIKKDEKKGATKKVAAGRDRLVVNAQLSTFNELSKKAEATAREAEMQVDPSVYDYDGVWDDMKSVDRKKQKAEEADALERKPKYMENLLQAAEIRKRDQLRAKERLLQKEREAEGEEYADKESFVTGAYKKQQEEMRKLEEEERLREGMCVITFISPPLRACGYADGTYQRGCAKNHKECPPSTAICSTKPKANTTKLWPPQHLKIRKPNLKISLHQRGSLMWRLLQSSRPRVPQWRSTRKAK